MRPAKISMWLCCLLLVAAFAPNEAEGDVIKFKHGGTQQCVILEESENSVRFLSSMGPTSMPRSRIESIKLDSDKVNAEFTKRWEEKKKSRVRRPKPPPAPVKKKGPAVKRTYNVEIIKRRIALGGRAAGGAGEQQVATFVIKDMGVVKGSRLFDVTATSHRSGNRRISSADFHAFLSNGARIAPRPLEGYKELKATLITYGSASGFVAFPDGEKLETLVHKSDVAEFDLDLATGKYSTRSGPF